MTTKITSYKLSFEDYLKARSGAYRVRFFNLMEEIVKQPNSVLLMDAPNKVWHYRGKLSKAQHQEMLELGFKESANA